MPTAGVAGETVVLAGEGLEDAQYVLFDGTAAEFTAETNDDGSTILKAVVPSRARSGRITVVGVGHALTTAVEFTRILPLDVEKAGRGKLELKWPLATEEFALEFTPGTLGAGWQEVMTSRLWTNGGYTWSAGAAERAAFFRLRRR